MWISSLRDLNVRGMHFWFGPILALEILIAQETQARTDSEASRRVSDREELESTNRSRHLLEQRISDERRRIENDLDERISLLETQLNDKRQSLATKSSELQDIRDRRSTVDLEYTNKMKDMESEALRIKKEFSDQLQSLRMRLEEILSAERKVQRDRFTDDVRRFCSLEWLNVSFGFVPIYLYSVNNVRDIDSCISGDCGGYSYGSITPANYKNDCPLQVYGWFLSLSVYSDLVPMRIMDRLRRDHK